MLKELSKALSLSQRSFEHPPTHEAAGHNLALHLMVTSLMIVASSEIMSQCHQDKEWGGMSVG